jgi:hypothetical protein
VQSLYVDDALLGSLKFGSGGQHGVPNLRHCGRATTQCAGLKLMFLNLLHEFDAADRRCRAVEPFESEHRSGPLLDSPMILLNHVV